MEKKSALFILLLLGIFIYGDFNIVLKACLIYGFLIPWILLNNNTTVKRIYFVFLLTIPTIGLIIASLIHPEVISYRPVLLWTSVVLTGAILNYGYNKLKFKKSYKTALLLSFLMLLIIPIFRKYGEGNYMVLATLSYFAAGYYIFRKNEQQFLMPAILLFVPYLMVLLIDASISDSFTGFLLILPPYFISIGLLLIYKLFSLQFNHKVILSFIILLVLMAILWPIQENYAHWIYSKPNPVIDKNHFKFITADESILMESSDKKLSLFLFTSAYCGNCEREYPYFSDLARKYTSDTTIGFYCTFLCFREKDTVFYEKLAKQEFEFDWSLAYDSENIFKDLKMQGVPSLLIIDENDKVIYNGYCRIRPWLLINSPEKMIEEYLKN